MMTNKVTTMLTKAKDAMKDSGTAGLRKFVRKDLKEIKERVDTVHTMIVRNVELKLISEDIAVEQMESLYTYADNLLETWFTQVDNTIEFYNDLKNNMFTDKDFGKLTDDEYKCLKLIVKERTKLQRLSAEIQAMVCYVDTMLEDFGYLDDRYMDDEDDEDPEEDVNYDGWVPAYIQNPDALENDPLDRIISLRLKTNKVNRYTVDYENDPSITLYNENGPDIVITVTPDKVVHISDDDKEYNLFELKGVAGSTRNSTVRDAINTLESLVTMDADKKDSDKEDNTNEEA